MTPEADVEPHRALLPADSSRLRIALVHQAEARSARTWSGTTLSMFDALNKHVGQVIDLSPYRGSRLSARVLGAALGTFTRKRWSTAHEPMLARRIGAYFTKLLRRDRYDVVFAPAGSTAIAWLETDLPIVYFSDATWRLLEGYYECYTNLLRRYRMSGEEIEQRAIRKARLCLFSSQWAADSAIAHYGAPPERVGVIPFGPNLAVPPTRDQALRPRTGGRVALLLCGVSYENKGGPIARQTLIRLLELGVDATLTIVGCDVPARDAHPRLRAYPFLDKRVPAQRETFERIWREADIFILPTRFDATPIVLCEAAAHGIPSFASDTGGLASVVRDGVTGFLLPYHDDGSGYAAAIAKLLGDHEAYRRMRLASRDEYEQRLNWDAWGETIGPWIRSLFPR